MLFIKSKNLLKVICFSAALGLFWVSLSFAQQEFVKAKVVYKVEGMEKVKVFNDVIYKQAGGEDLKMDIYQPPNLKAGEKLPVVLYVHGGYLSREFPVKPKDWEIFISHGKLIAASGMMGITFNHRYYGWDKQNLDDSFSDVRDAIRYVIENAEKYNIDPERLCLWSFSGGGPHLSIPLREGMDYVRCLVSYYGILDMKSLLSSWGSRGNLDWLNGYSPIDYLIFENHMLPPFMITRAGMDDPSLNATIDAFIGRALEMNLDIEVANHPAGFHGFDVLNDDRRTREILEDTISFIKRNLFKEYSDKDELMPFRGRLLSSIKNGEIIKVKAFLSGEKGGFTWDQVVFLKSALTEPVLNRIGYNFLTAGNPAKAVELFEWIAQLYPDSPNAFDSLADGYEAAGSMDSAIKSSEKAIELLDKAANLDENTKNGIKKSVTERLKRLQK